MKTLWRREGGNLQSQTMDSPELEKRLRAQGFLALDELFGGETDAELGKLYSNPPMYDKPAIRSGKFK